MKTRDRIEEEVTYSPAVKTKNGHRIIPDDTHKAQGVTSKSEFGFFPQRMQGVKTVENGKDEAASFSPSMSLGRKADNVC